ncbi:MAG: ATP-binding protein [Myxococcota bacterium]
MKLSSSRPIQLVLLSVLVLAALTLLSAFLYKWQFEERLHSVEQGLANARSFQPLQRQLESRWLTETSAGWLNQISGRTPGQVADTLAAIDELLRLTPAADTRTRNLLNRVRSEYRSLDGRSGPVLLPIIATLQSAATSESLYREKGMSELLGSLQVQLIQALVVPGGVLVILLAFLAIIWRRLLRPIEQLESQISSVSEGDFTPLSEVDPGRDAPSVHGNFIKLARRLSDLEQKECRHADDLEQDVKAATRTLIEQQQNLARAERLSIAVEFAASLAHDIRNPLAAIQMSLSNLRAEIEDDDMAERVERISAEVVRLGRLVGDAVEFARRDPETPALFYMSDLVEELFALAKYQMPSEIELKHDIPDALQCRLPRERLQQALLNLIVNSATAIGQGAGRITVVARDSESDLEITVMDDGPGFPGDILSGGIRPFDTTRKDGAGLGLATARRLARENGGDIRISNRADDEGEQGARIALLLPSCVEDG